MHVCYRLHNLCDQHMSRPPKKQQKPSDRAESRLCVWYGAAAACRPTPRALHLRLVPPLAALSWLWAEPLLPWAYCHWAAHCTQPRGCGRDRMGQKILRRSLLHSSPRAHGMARRLGQWGQAQGACLLPSQRPVPGETTKPLLAWCAARWLPRCCPTMAPCC